MSHWKKLSYVWYFGLLLIVVPAVSMVLGFNPANIVIPVPQVKTTSGQIAYFIIVFCPTVGFMFLGLALGVIIIDRLIGK